MRFPLNFDFTDFHALLSSGKRGSAPQTSGHSPSCLFLPIELAMGLTGKERAENKREKDRGAYYKNTTNNCTSAHTYAHTQPSNFSLYFSLGYI